MDHKFSNGLRSRLWAGHFINWKFGPTSRFCTIWSMLRISLLLTHYFSFGVSTLLNKNREDGLAKCWDIIFCSLCYLFCFTWCCWKDFPGRRQQYCLPSDWDLLNFHLPNQIARLQSSIVQFSAVQRNSNLFTFFSDKAKVFLLLKHNLWWMLSRSLLMLKEATLHVSWISLSFRSNLLGLLK